jgi:hypothetical protein
MITIGPVSSLFDYATFFTMLFVFNAWNNAGLFQTGWFVESLTSQTLVVLIIRTRQVPFWKSKPSRYLALMLLFVISFAMIVPYTPLGEFFGFVPPPPTFYLALAGILGAYALLAETVKRWFYKRNAHRVEQILIPKRKTVYSISRMAKIVQDIVAVISLRPEDEITVESLVDDLRSAINYPMDSERVVQNLDHLRRSKLITIDWQRRTIKREKPLKEYVKKNVMINGLWPKIAEDWRRIRTIIQDKYGSSNAEYQETLSSKDKSTQ